MKPVRKSVESEHGAKVWFAGALSCALVASTVFVLSLGGGPARAVSTGTCNESGTTTITVTCTAGSGAWTPPPGVTTADFDLAGAAGGVSSGPFAGGTGGRTTASVAVSAAQTYRIAAGTKGGSAGPPAPPDDGVGGTGGAPGGADGGTDTLLDGGGGGGASIVATGAITTDTTNWILAAGAGGGGGIGNGEPVGGAGGGSTGGSAPSGGAGGTQDCVAHLDGSPGAPGAGGGGGGFCGGAGGPDHFGGGGGSGFIKTDPGITGATTTLGAGSTGDGTVTITYTVTFASAQPASSTPPSGPPGPAIDTAPPDTTITSGPDRSPSTGRGAGLPKTRDRTPDFSFVSSESSSTFHCSVDGGTFTSCTSPHSTSKLARGKTHTFAVRAVDAAGNVDPTPASRSFVVKERGKRH